MYHAMQALYRATLESNPGCWMARAKISATFLLESGRVPEGMTQFEATLRIEPGLADALRTTSASPWNASAAPKRRSSICRPPFASGRTTPKPATTQARRCSTPSQRGGARSARGGGAVPPWPMAGGTGQLHSPWAGSRKRFPIRTGDRARSVGPGAIATSAAGNRRIAGTRRSPSSKKPSGSNPATPTLISGSPSPFGMSAGGRRPSRSARRPCGSIPPCRNESAQIPRSGRIDHPRRWVGVFPGDPWRLAVGRRPGDHP